MTVLAAGQRSVSSQDDAYHSMPKSGLLRSAMRPERQIPRVSAKKGPTLFFYDILFPNMENGNCICKMRMRGKCLVALSALI